MTQAALGGRGQWPWLGKVASRGLERWAQNRLRPNLDMHLCGDARVADKTVREGRLSYYFGSSAAARRSKNFKACHPVR